MARGVGEVIPARKGRWFTMWFAGQARSRLRRTFGGVHIAGTAAARAAVVAGPVVVVSNHTAWWDPLLALYVSTHVLGSDAYAMMDAGNLRRLPFFGRVGAFGVDLARPEDGAAAIRYAARLLDRPGRLVWIFPQGHERPVTERPLGFRPGSAEIARVARSPVLPVALRYEFGGRERPDVLVDLGVSLPPDRDVVRARAAHEGAVTAGLDRLEATVRSGDLAGYDPVLRAPADRLDAAAERMLSWLTG